MWTVRNRFIQLFGVFSSYVFIIVVFINFSKLNIGGADNIVIILFVMYVLLSFIWGVDYKSGIRIVLPFAIYFATKLIVTDEAQICKLSRLTILGYVIPVVGSAIYILMGESEQTFVIFKTGLKRYSGLYLVVHALAHAMFVYIVMFLVYLNTSEGNAKKSRLLIILGYLLAALAVFNIYQSGTRTVLIGLGIFLIIYLLGKRHYLLLTGMGAAAVVSAGQLGKIQSLFFDIIAPLQGQGKIEKLGSGRYGLWEGEMGSFFSQPFEVQMLGKGLGHSGAAIFGKTTFGSSHNDFIAVLVSLGYIGFILYIIILLMLFVSIISSKIDRIKKSIFLGMLFSITFMNFSSNSYISRFDLAQYFAFIFALFYSYHSYCTNQIRPLKDRYDAIDR